MGKQAEAGKGSKPRHQQDHDAFTSGWDRIFGSKQTESKDEIMTDVIFKKLCDAIDETSVSKFIEEIVAWKDYLEPIKNAGIKDVDFDKYFNHSCIIDGHLFACVKPVGWDECEGEYVERIVGAYPIVERNHNGVKVDIDSAVFFKFTGFYNSYEGIDFDSEYDATVVTPRIIEVVDYEQLY